MSSYGDEAGAVGGLVMSKSLPEEKELTLSSVLRDESGLRKRHVWHDVDEEDGDSLHSDDSDLLDDELAEDDEDAVGCPLPSTPEDHQLLEEEVGRVMQSPLGIPVSKLFCF